MCRVLQCVAVCCSVLQCVEVCCSVLQCAMCLGSMLSVLDVFGMSLVICVCHGYIDHILCLSLVVITLYIVVGVSCISMLVYFAYR